MFTYLWSYAKNFCEYKQPFTILFLWIARLFIWHLSISQIDLGVYKFHNFAIFFSIEYG